MNITEKTKNNIRIAVLIGLIAAIVLSISDFDSSCDELRTNILRLHIIANSNSEYDQALKLKIRDAILEQSLGCFEGCAGVDEAIIIAKDNRQAFESIANKVIADNNADYRASVCIGSSDFNTRVYDDFTLPAGTYNSLIVKLGRAEGKNWWCVVYPSVCVPAASDKKLSCGISKKGTSVAENPQKYVMKFKVVEWYEKLKNKLKK